MIKLAKSFLLTIVILGGLYVYCSHSNVDLDIHRKEVVSGHILKLLELTNVSHDGTLSNIVDQTQKFWLRKPNQERWDIEQYVSQHNDEIKLIFEQMGLYHDVKPQLQEYEYVLIMGALFGRIKDRMQYAIELWNQGIRFKKIVMLGGARPVVAEQGENKELYEEWAGTSQLCIEPKTETDVCKFVYEHSSMPQAMRALPIEFVDAPMNKSQDGTKVTRPTTIDTIKLWLASNPEEGRCLYISNQPYVDFQHSVVKTCMPNQFYVETVGLAGNKELNIGVVLDSIARYIYQEQKRIS